MHELHIDLQFLPGKKRIEKIEKLIVKLHDETECVIQLRNLKVSLNLGLVLKKVRRVINFNQSPWLK